jgi:hypothetical protein
MEAVSERIVDMIEQSKTMTDDELEALVAQADPEVIEKLHRRRGAAEALWGQDEPRAAVMTPVVV